ncbi:hypothetical protein PhaeoP83_04189 (plasmid) [Phaeobacter inhibens]|uniref:Uncharacterized protein n=1 Tax=Phaeobacter inhibens TaxID=221822 RepID=A0ABM6RKE8_9RHOB|nr:hypothetical protein [Phaeobacter inhibens]AUQ52407.1 hypothetical protein PhaeoP83_04189 [Phaeobacter inhibens]AUQ97012.1 hypothetical protein PhaeoP66_04286 [Phaeobacter inhibens]AUR22212.1 hypothetical protein PhaeoP80_04189 [Phaeobacter inhibens]
MHLFASHFGCYEVDYHGAQPVLVPFRKDPKPLVVGQSYLELAQDQARLRRPLARKGRLAGDGGGARGDDEFVEITSDAAVDRVAGLETAVFLRALIAGQAPGAFTIRKPIANGS